MNNCADFNDTVAIDSLLRHVMPVVNNIPYELGVDTLRQAFITFARRTSMLAVTLDIVPQTDVLDYELIAPDGYQIHMVRQAGYANCLVSCSTVDYWFYCGGVCFCIVGNKTIVFKNTPSADSNGYFQVVATVVPTECVTRIPREVSNPFGIGIAKGALAEILLYKNKPWYDPELARRMQRDFSTAINAGTNLNLMNRGGSDMRARGRPWV